MTKDDPDLMTEGLGDFGYDPDAVGEQIKTVSDEIVELVGQLDDNADVDYAILVASVAYAHDRLVPKMDNPAPQYMELLHYYEMKGGPNE